MTTITALDDLYEFDILQNIRPPKGFFNNQKYCVSMIFPHRITRLTTYFKDSFYEMKRVVWPTRKQAFVHSVVVVIMSIVVAAFLAGLDIIFSIGIQRLLQLKF